MSFGRWIEDEQQFALEKEIACSLENDCVKRFVRTISQLGVTTEALVRGQEFLMKALDYRAHQCAAALLNGDTPFILDVNRPTHVGMFPLHHAAWNCDAWLIKLLLLHGAYADVYAITINGDDTPSLPLHVSLHLSRCCLAMTFILYAKEASVYQLLTLISLKRCQVDLECVGLLACNTRDLDHEFLRYANEGNFLFLSILLAVAWEKLSHFVGTILTCNELEISEAKKNKLSLLLGVFVKGGHELTWYIKMNKCGVPAKEISEHVAGLLGVDPTATDLSSLLRPSRREYFRDKDINSVGASMEHFQTKKKPLMIKPYRKHVITGEQKSLIATEVGKELPIPIPSYSYYSRSAADFIKAYKHDDVAPVAQDMKSTKKSRKRKATQTKVKQEKRSTSLSTDLFDCFY